MASHPLPETEPKARWTARLRAQAADVERLTAGLDDDTLARRPIPGKWSLKELVCHLWRVQQVFEGRIRAMLEQNLPPLVPWEPDDDPQGERMLESPATELVKGFLLERGELIERLETLGPADWKREGRHPEYAHYDVGFCVEYLAHHEGHHLYQIFQRRAML